MKKYTTPDAIFTAISSYDIITKSLSISSISVFSNAEKNLGDMGFDSSDIIGF